VKAMPYKDKHSKAAIDSAHKRWKKYYDKNSKKLYQNKKEWSQEYYQSHKDLYKKYWWNKKKKLFNIDRDDYDRILKEQNNACIICHRHKDELGYTLHIDHNHETGKFRGLLCYNCNAGLGNFRDNIDSLKNAINYLMTR